MPGRYAELAMYVAPQPVQVASEQWLTRIVALLDAPRRDGRGLELLELFRSPDLLLTQTCGYPLMTLLRGQVQLVGRPRYELNDSSAGNHCSLIVSRATDPRIDLAEFKGSRGGDQRPAFQQRYEPVSSPSGTVAAGRAILCQRGHQRCPSTKPAPCA